MLACTAAATRPLVARRLVTRASAATAGTEQRTLKALNITRSTLIDSNGGRAVRSTGKLRVLPFPAQHHTVVMRLPRPPFCSRTAAVLTAAIAAPPACRCAMWTATSTRWCTWPRTTA